MNHYNLFEIKVQTKGRRREEQKGKVGNKGRRCGE
jgi:hypothetical protein